MMSYGGVDYFQFAPCFRDEDSRHDRVNGEFYQLDLEMRAEQLQAVTKLATDMLTDAMNHFGVGWVLHAPLTYAECVARYGSDKPTDLDHRVVVRSPTTARAPLHLIVVTDYPMMEREAGTGRLTYAANPFALATADWASAYQFDIVVSGIEVMSGGLRETKPGTFVRFQRVLGKSYREIRDSYGSLLRAMESGIAQHGGFGMGIERLTMLLYNHLHPDHQVTVNEVVPFPQDSLKREGLTGAPTRTKTKTL